jgi:hypothetical protein
MKKLFNTIKYAITALVISSLLVGHLYAFSTSMTIQPGVMTNFPIVVTGALKVTQVIVSASATNVANLKFVDTLTNSLTVTNAAYTNILTYATNVTQIYTNYYGVIQTNILTNQLVDVTNTVAAATNNCNIPLSYNVATNATVTTSSAGYYFVNGLWITNAAAPGSGPATVSITYQQ